MKTKMGIRLGLLSFEIYLLAACTPLAGAEWTLTSLNGNEVISDTTITAAFKGGIMKGSAGCNCYSVNVELNKNTITFGEGAITEILCTGVDGLMEQEKSYLNLLLNSVKTFTYTSEELELRNESGNTILLFQKRLPENYRGVCLR